MESDEILKYTDFGLVSHDGEIHPCHKHVLNNCSPVFKAMLEMVCVETINGVMKVPDFDAQTVKNFIQYIIAKEAGSDILDRLRQTAQPGEHIFKRQFDKTCYTVNLLLMAHCYQVDDLQTDCIEHLSKNLNKENVVETWIAANTIDCDKLKKAALDFLAKHFNQGDTSDFPGLYHSEKTFQLMEELHQYMFRYQGQLFCSKGAQSFCKRADTSGSLHEQGLSPESGTTITLEIQQEQNRKCDEKLKSAGRLLSNGRRIFSADK